MATMKARTFAYSLCLLAIGGLVGCSTNDGEKSDTGSSSLADTSTGGSTDGDPTDTTAGTSTGVDTGAASDSTDSSATEPEPTTGGATGTTEPESTTGGSTGMATDPPGSGVDAYCFKLIECGQVSGLEDCRFQAYTVWGTCPSRQALLDAFGACMAEIPCGGDQAPCEEVGNALLGSPPCP